MMIASIAPRTTWLTLLVVLFFATVPSLHAEDGIVEKKDLEPFQGNWIVTSIHCPDPKREEAIKKAIGSVRFSGREVEITSPDMKSKHQWLILKIDSKAEPREIDFRVYDEGDKRFETALAIYKFDKKSLVITVSLMQGIRPDEFGELPPDNQFRQFTMTLERAPK
jgi:uncharacterized protein (TIGR03067 family)